MNTTTETTETTPISQDNFLSFGLSEEVLKSLETMNFTSPTPIQKQALPMLLGEDTDFIGLASTGTGKTGAFGIPLVEKIDTSVKATQALVLCPTRELALQVSGQLSLIGKDKGLRVVTIYGGASYQPQIEGVRRGAHIIVGTPGRLVDMLDQKYVKLDQVKTLVLDEADEMLSLGFKDDLEMILEATHNPEIECKTWLFSATMNNEVRKISSEYLKTPKQVQIKKDESQQGTIEQIYYTVQSRDKLEVLARILATNKNFYGIIFCQTKQEVANVANLLQKRGLLVDCLHGDRSQKEREMILAKFRKRQVSVIVATDVAARGLDVKDLTHVINFNLPRELDTYTHRIGRTGRNGQSGVAISLIAPDQLRLLKRVMDTTKAKIVKGDIPSVRDIARFQVMASLDQLTRMTPDSQRFRMAERILTEIQDHAILTEELTVKDLLARVIALKHSEFMMDDGRELDFVGTGKLPRELEPRTGKQVRESRFGNRERSGERRERSGERREFRGEKREFRSERSEWNESRPRREQFDESLETRSEERPRRARFSDGKPRGEFRSEERPRRTRFSDEKPRGEFKPKREFKKKDDHKSSKKEESIRESFFSKKFGKKKSDD